MLLAIISPLPLGVESEDFTLLSVGVSGNDSGKHVYVNQRALKTHKKFYFDGADFETTVNLLKSELGSTKNMRSTLLNWFDQPSILVIPQDGVEEFNQLYEYTKDPDMISALSNMDFDDNVSIGQYLLINGIGELFNIMRKMSAKGEN